MGDDGGYSGDTGGSYITDTGASNFTNDTSSNYHNTSSYNDTSNYNDNNSASGGIGASSTSYKPDTSYYHNTSYYNSTTTESGTAAGGGGVSDKNAEDGPGSGPNADDTAGFRGKENGATDDSRYNNEDDNCRGGDDRGDHWSDAQDDDGKTGASNLEAITVVGGGGGGDDGFLSNGDAVFRPMLSSEDVPDLGGAANNDGDLDRNPCETCFFGTLVCCDCTIL